MTGYDPSTKRAYIADNYKVIVSSSSDGLIHWECTNENFEGGDMYNNEQISTILLGRSTVKLILTNLWDTMNHYNELIGMLQSHISKFHMTDAEYSPGQVEELIKSVARRTRVRVAAFEFMRALPDHNRAEVEREFSDLYGICRICADAVGELEPELHEVKQDGE